MKTCFSLLALVLAGCLNKKWPMPSAENNPLDHRIQTEMQASEARNQVRLKGEQMPAYNRKDLKTILYLTYAAGIFNGGVNVTLNDAGEHILSGTPRFSNEEFFHVLERADVTKDYFISPVEAEVYFTFMKEKYAKR